MLILIRGRDSTGASETYGANHLLWELSYEEGEQKEPWIPICKAWLRTRCGEGSACCSFQSGRTYASNNVCCAARKDPPFPGPQPAARWGGSGVGLGTHEFTWVRCTNLHLALGSRTHLHPSLGSCTHLGSCSSSHIASSCRGFGERARAMLVVGGSGVSPYPSSGRAVLCDWGLGNFPGPALTPLWKSCSCPGPGSISPCQRPCRAQRGPARLRTRMCHQMQPRKHRIIFFLHNPRISE